MEGGQRDLYIFSEGTEAQNMPLTIITPVPALISTLMEQYPGLRGRFVMGLIIRIRKKCKCSVEHITNVMNEYFEYPDHHNVARCGPKVQRKRKEVTHCFACSRQD